jgi:hypothetical protein
VFSIVLQVVVANANGFGYFFNVADRCRLCNLYIGEHAVFFESGNLLHPKKMLHDENQPGKEMHHLLFQTFILFAPFFH